MSYPDLGSPMQPIESSSPYWETFAHGADIGVRGVGPTPASTFEQAALALTSVVTAPERVDAGRCVELRCEAPDRELLLYEWLNALVFEMDTRRMLFGRFEVNLDGAGRHLTARAHGEPVDIARHEPAVEVKGATLTELKVAQGEDGAWRAQCVVDV
jgi:tRNA nucleotidyltransferase (CCA-adding enzyme)